MGEYPHRGVAEALAPTTHPADVVGQQAGAREGQARGGEDPPNPRHVSAAKARLRRLVPFLVGDVLVEVNKALKALVEWTTQHWGEDVELVGEEDLEPMNMNHHDSFGFGHRGDQVRGWHDGRGTRGRRRGGQCTYDNYRIQRKYT